MSFRRMIIAVSAVGALALASCADTRPPDPTHNPATQAQCEAQYKLVKSITRARQFQRASKEAETIPCPVIRGKAFKAICKGFLVVSREARLDRDFPRAASAIEAASIVSDNIADPTIKKECYDSIQSHTKRLRRAIERANR